LCDKGHTDSSYEEDSQNIMCAINIKKYISSRTAGAEAMIVLQLLNSTHRHHLTASACGDANCQVFYRHLTIHPPAHGGPRAAGRRECWD